MTRQNFSLQSASKFAAMTKTSIRVTVVGDGDVGKTCMLIVYKDRKFDERYVPTVFDVWSMTVPINQIDYTIILQDTAGQEEFDKLRQLAYKETDVFILCYAVDNLNSMANITEKWAPELRRCCPKAKIILAATRCDRSRTISTKEGQKLARVIKADGFIENSSKKQININETFSMAYTAVANRPYRNTDKCALL